MKQSLPNKALENYSAPIAGQVQPLALALGSARHRRIREALEDLREKRDSCGLHFLTFVPYMHRLTLEQRDQAEADLQAHFRLWWDTWIRPKLNAIEAELPNTKVSHAHPEKGQ